MAELIMTAGQAVVRDLVGTEIFLQGLDLVNRGHVTHVQWHHKSNRAFGSVDSAGHLYSAIAILEVERDGRPSPKGRNI